MLDNFNEKENQQMNIKEMIELLDIADSWKERFRIIAEWYENGLGMKMTEKLKNVPFSKRPEIYSSIYIKNGGFGTFVAAYLFGPFYYLFKGLWLKAIIYTLIIMFIFFVICLFIPTFQLTGGAGGVLFAMLAPFDYYRLKVLKKQW